MSVILLIHTNDATAFLLQRALRQAQVAAQTHVVASTAEALALLAPPPVGLPLTPCLILVELILPRQGPTFAEAYQQLRTPQAKAPVVYTAVEIPPLATLQQLQQQPIAGLVELPLAARSLAFLRQLCAAQPVA